MGIYAHKGSPIYTVDDTDDVTEVYVMQVNDYGDFDPDGDGFTVGHTVTFTNGAEAHGRWNYEGQYLADAEYAAFNYAVSIGFNPEA